MMARRYDWRWKRNDKKRITEMRIRGKLCGRGELKGNVGRGKGRLLLSYFTLLSLPHDVVYSFSGIVFHGISILYLTQSFFSFFT